MQEKQNIDKTKACYEMKLRQCLFLPNESLLHYYLSIGKNIVNLIRNNMVLAESS